MTLKKSRIGAEAPPFIVFANNKGGPGKTLLTHHVALCADQSGLKVLVVDLDILQGNIIRRIAAAHGKNLARDALPKTFQFGDHGSKIVVAARLHDVVVKGYDVVLVDTPPGSSLPEGRAIDLVVIPVNSLDAAHGAHTTIGRARKVGTLPWVILTGGDAGGRVEARLFNEIVRALPKDVARSEVPIPFHASIVRSCNQGEPAWGGARLNRGAAALLATANSIVDWVRERRTTGAA